MRLPTKEVSETSSSPAVWAPAAGRSRKRKQRIKIIKLRMFHLKTRPLAALKRPTKPYKNKHHLFYAIMNSKYPISSIVTTKRFFGVKIKNICRTNGEGERFRWQRYCYSNLNFSIFFIPVLHRSCGMISSVRSHAWPLSVIESVIAWKSLSC